MGCLTVSITPVGGISCRVSLIGGMCASVQPVGRIYSRAERIGAFEANATRIGGIFCRVYKSCSPNIREPYLEIEPTVVWVIAGQTQNDVLSNTYWNIN